MLWSLIPNRAVVPDTSNRPQHHVANYVGIYIKRRRLPLPTPQARCPAGGTTRDAAGAGAAGLGGSVHRAILRVDIRYYGPYDLEAHGT